MEYATERLPKGALLMASNLRVFWQAIVQGLFINATLREMFLLLPRRRLPLMPGAWRGMSKKALSAIVMLREMLLPPLLLLMPGAWQGMWSIRNIPAGPPSATVMLREMLQPLRERPAGWRGITEAVSETVTLREMLPVLPAPEAWQGLTIGAYILTATATATPP